MIVYVAVLICSTVFIISVAGRVARAVEIGGRRNLRVT
jgi:hypothetical protein